MTSGTQRYEIKLFAAAKQLVGRESVELELAAPADVAQLREKLAASHPPLAELLAHCRFAVNAAYVNESTRLSPSDEIACIPPVSGG